MAVLPDPAALETVARHIDTHADDLRARASRLVAAAERVRWHSAAATAFRADVTSLASRCRRAAGEIDDAAAALRRHATVVHRAEAVVQNLERSVERTALTVERSVERTALTVERSVGRTAQTVERMAGSAVGGLAHALGL